MVKKYLVCFIVILFLFGLVSCTMEVEQKFDENVFEYATEIPEKEVQKTDIKDVAFYIDADLSLFEVCINMATYYLKQTQIDSSYAEYIEATEYLNSIIDTLKEYPEYKDFFLDEDISEFSSLIDKSIDEHEKMLNYYSENDGVNYRKSARVFVSYIDDISDIVDELKDNVAKYK